MERFDLNPAWNQARIPYNYGTGPSQFSMNMRMSKSFGIGPKVEGGRMVASADPAAAARPPAAAPAAADLPEAGLGPGGLSGSGGPPRMDQAVPRRYSLTFAAMARNIFNSVNLAQPVGVLESPLFGKSNALWRADSSLRRRQIAASTCK